MTQKFSLKPSIVIYLIREQNKQKEQLHHFGQFLMGKPIFYIYHSSQQEIINVQFIKISEILAMFGSIFSVLLTIGIPVNIINEHLMNKQIFKTYMDTIFNINAKISEKDIQHIQKKVFENLDRSNLIIELTCI